MKSKKEIQDKIKDLVETGLVKGFRVTLSTDEQQFGIKDYVDHHADIRAAIMALLWVTKDEK